ncbi:MAG: AAA family ATPase [Clostridia bacterium]|nr:AAA family ATPase [Clostridia bacterium]
MNKKDTVIKEVIDYYINSRDFNGLPIYNMKNYGYNVLCDLIDDNLIEVLNDADGINPHIKSFSIDTPLETQKKYISNNKLYSVLYPTKKALANVEIDAQKPFTSIMLRGSEQFKILYFDINILDTYASNPKYRIVDYGYRGQIYPKNQYCDEDIVENDYIKDFGMAYKKSSDRIERAIGVFICDLAKLPPKKQLRWQSFLHSNQNDYCVASGFIDNLILGKWVTKVWIFDALLEEINIINKQCTAIGIPTLFCHTFSTHYTEKPEGYRNILFPTLKNFDDFVLVLEKITVNNISYKTFQVDAPYVKKVKRNDDTGNNKSSLVMLEEWLKQNIRTPEDISKQIINPLRNLRKMRQQPAHEIVANQYDISLYQRQADLMDITYDAIRAIRLFLANHPLAKDVEVPEYLISGKNIGNF